MNRSLLNYTCSLGILFCALTPTFSQVPGDPKLETTKRPLVLPNKSTSKLSPELQSLVSRSRKGDVTTLAKPSPGNFSNGADNLVQIYNGKVVIDVTVSGDISKAKSELEKAGATITGSYGRVISAMIPISSLSSLEQVSQLRYVKPAYKPAHHGQVPVPGVSVEMLPLSAQMKSGSAQGKSASAQLKSAPAQLKSASAQAKAGSAKLKIVSEDRHFSDATASPLWQPDAVETVYSQGDTAQGSYLARAKYKADGKGVKVGILSDSYNNRGGAETGVLNGELPGPSNPYNRKKPVKVLLELDSGGIDEGRAMAEIVHDVAPGAEIAFSSAFFGQGAFAQSIIDLAKTGCQVITDDIYYFAEPFFQDGIIAQAVDQVVKKGATYFSAAGNHSLKSYESVYRPSTFEPLGPGYGTAHNFAAPNEQPRYFQPVFIPTGGVFTVGFQWDDPFFSAGGAGAESDMDIYIYDFLGNLRAVSWNRNLVSGDPVEVAQLYNGTSNNTFYISIVKYSGLNPSRLKYIMYGAGQFYNVPIPGQLASTVFGHTNSEGAISTAASWYRATPAYGAEIPLVEGFSSVGGTAIYFDKEGVRIPAIIRQKPDITAPDGANTSFFTTDESIDTDKYPNFYGTSAAAPHAAGVAALMIDAQKLKTLTPAQIRGIMSVKTYDMDNRYTPGFDKGYDYNTGTGLIRAEQSVGEVKFPNLYIKNLELVSLCSDEPGKKRNWKIINPNPFEVKVHWFLTGFNQDKKVYVQPGETYFSTETGYYRNKPVPNIVILDWEDNFGFTRFDLASATTNECKNDVAGTQVLSAGEQAVLIKERPAKPEIADVFPNPSVSQFKLYLSLNNPGKTDITLLSADGKMLYRNTVAGTGIYDIDASKYKPGFYVMKINQGGFSKTIKLVKQ